MEQIPLEIGPYEIKEEIGRGGMAVVYRARDTRLGRDIALKVLLPQHAHDQAFMRRFVREGQASESLCHDNIVRAYETGNADGHYYMAMQLVGGGTLLDYVQKRKQLLSADEIISILSQVGAGLDYAHSLGFLHRDIKLSNILMTEDGDALLSDFGVVKFMDQQQTAHTMAGHTVGTPAFMAPEQARGEDVDVRADVYSLGVIAYTLFTGRLPFSADNQPQLMYKIVHETPVPPESINPDIPVGVQPALKKVMQKNPESRYPSAGEFVAALVSGRMYGSETAVPKSTQSLKVPTRITPLPHLQEQRRWEGAIALGWTINLTIAIGLLWFVLSPFLQLDAKFAAALDGGMTSGQFIEHGALASSLHRFSVFSSQLNSNTLRNLWNEQNRRVANFDFDRSMAEITTWIDKQTTPSTGSENGFSLDRTMRGIRSWFDGSSTGVDGSQPIFNTNGASQGIQNGWNDLTQEIPKQVDVLNQWMSKTWTGLRKNVSRLEMPTFMRK